MRARLEREGSVVWRTGFATFLLRLKWDMANGLGGIDH